MRPIRNFRSAPPSALEDGNIYTGANIENLSFPEGWCAETTAISHMVMAGSDKIVEVAVIAEKLAALPAVRRLPPAACRVFRRKLPAIFLCDEDRREEDTVDVRPAAVLLRDRDTRMTAAAELLQARLASLSPKCGIVLGSGLGSLVEAGPIRCGFPMPIFRAFRFSAVSGHAGELVAGTTRRTFRSSSCRGGCISTNAVMRTPCGGPIETLKALGVESLILTNSAGSLREELPPGSVMQITDHINFSGVSPLIGRGATIALSA